MSHMPRARATLEHEVVLAGVRVFEYKKAMKRIFGLITCLSTCLSVCSFVCLFALGSSAQAQVAVQSKPHSTAWNGRIFDIQAGEWISESQARKVLGETQILVLGEKHNTTLVQEQEARALDWATESQGFGPLDHWVLGWEFLNHSDQIDIDAAWAGFKNGVFTAEEVMDRLQGEGRERTYLPILNSGVRFGGVLKGMNLSRTQKAPILSGGLASLDPALLPPGFEMGGEGYRERFDEAMGAGHATPDQLDRYFQAQCVTDDVLAFQLLQPRVRFRALVVGSFHADYADGVVARLRTRAPDQRMHVIRFVDASDYMVSELDPDLSLAEPIIHKRYGKLADWVWFAGEPRTAR